MVLCRDVAVVHDELHDGHVVCSSPWNFGGVDRNSVGGESLVSEEWRNSPGMCKPVP